MATVNPGDFYDNLLGTTIPMNYDVGAGDVVYPSPDMVSVFGPIYAPRIYGKDLTSFEIASSGAVSIALEDTQSFLLTRDVANSNVMINTLSNDSFGIYTNNSNMYLVFDSTSNNATLYGNSNVNIIADSNLNITAADQLNLTGNSFNLSIASTLEFNSGQDIIFSASNDVITNANSNITMTASNSMTTTVGNDYIISADSNVSFTSKTGYLSMSANNSNMSIVLDSATDEMSIYSLNTIDITTSNDMTMYALSNMYITADTGGLLMSANNSNVYILMDATTQNMTMYTSNNFNLTSSNDMVLSAVGSIQTTAVNVGLVASGSVDVVSGADASFSAASNLVISGANSNVTMTLDSATNDLGVYSLHDINMTSSNSTSITSVADFGVNSAGGDVSMTFDSATKSATLTSLNDVTVDATTGLLTTHGGTATTMSTDNGTYFTLSNNNTAYLTASNMNFDAGTGTITETAGTINTTTGLGGVNYTVGGNDILKIQNDRIVVNGGIDIMGTLNSIDTTITELYVEDKTINLAHSSNSTINDGDANTQSGFVVEGTPLVSDLNIPTNVADSNILPIYEKSIKWNYNDTDPVLGFVDNVGLGGVGTSNIESESYWEVKGGGLRITACKPVIDGSGVCTGSNVVSFGMRVNHLDELEIVKKYYTGSQYVVKRVAKFGRVLAL